MKTLFVIWTFSLATAAAQTGALTGRVVDARSGESLPGVNVLVQGTLRGAATDTSGRYSVTGIRPGAYTVTFTLVGYRREVRPGITVTAGAVTDLVVRLTAVAISTEPVVVTASKREQSLQEVPASVSVMDAAALSYRNALTVDDALRYVPGVNMTYDQVNIRGSSGYSRGAGSRVLLLVDGIPLLTGDTGELNFESIPTGQIERIEVVKGAASALYGSSALGGVINVITRRVPDEPETRIRTFGGMYASPSFSQWDWSGRARLQSGISASHSKRFGPVGLSLYGSRMTDDSYRQNDWKKRTNLSLRSDIGLSSDDVLAVTANFLDQYRGAYLYWKDLNNALVPPDVYQGETIHSTRFYTTAIYTHTVASNALVTTRAVWFKNRFVDALGSREDVSNSDVVRGEVQLSWSPSDRHILAFGAEGNIDRVRATLFGNHHGGGGAAYAQDEIKLIDPLELTLGIRYDIQSLESAQTNSQVNPKAALVYTASAGTAVRASVGRGFRSPTVAESFTSTNIGGFTIVPNPALKPERSISYEVGVNQVLGATAVIDLALFENDFWDLIETGFNAQGQGQFSNVTRARIRGLEFSSQLMFFQRALSCDLSYTYVDPRDLTAHDVLKYRHRHIVYLSALGRVGMFSLGADYRYLSRMERIDQEFVTLGIIKNGDVVVPINVVDVRFGADFSTMGVPLNATFNINNIFQDNYVEIIGNMAPPRSYVLTLESRF
jgi:outer membrane receptor for ferrienterochelin and colicins